MADDTRQSPQTNTKEDLSREALNVHPENRAFTGTQWQGGKAIGPYTPPSENANMMAGGTEHTAGGKVPEVTFYNALTTGPPITEIHKRPCVRDAFMTGIIGGGLVGASRLIFRASVWKACSWTVGGFCGISGAKYQFCMYQRNAEREGMLRAMDIINKKDAERKAREERKTRLREERRDAKEKELDAQYKAAGGGGTGGGKPWYKFW